MNQSQLLAKKYGLPEFKVIWIPIDDFENSIHSECYSQKIPLYRDISALMTLALDQRIASFPYDGYVEVVIGDDDYVGREQYGSHPTKLDALCECLCQALLADEG